MNTREIRPMKMTDTLFQDPYIDMDEWRDEPVRHRYVHGGFKGTKTLFSFYFPAKENFEGRFFQYITPVPDSENLSQGASGEEDRISFSISSGAYFVETNGGGVIDLQELYLEKDQSYGAYRANAASAEYSKVVATEMYGKQKIYGYAYGGSGGAYRTVGSIENTEGVWDGAVPYVIGSPMAVPNVFSVRMHAMRVLKDKFPQIVDALEPGGSGDMYAGLNDEEKAALEEVTKMGFPPESWFNHKTMGVHAIEALYPGLVVADSKYFQDFWTVTGYLGTDSPESLEKDRIQQAGKISASIYKSEAEKMGLIGAESDRERGTADLAWKKLSDKGDELPVGFKLDVKLKNVQFLGGDLIIKSGDAAGKRIQLTAVENDIVLIGPAQPEVLLAVKPGDEVVVDNSNFLALQTYHRHQVPGKEYSAWDQFRNADGTPIYPQRPMILGPVFTESASGVVPSGKFEGKMILPSSLWDQEAFPWQADFYRAQVEKHLGNKTDDHLRLWYSDHAMHRDLPIHEDPTHIVSYLGVVQQALRDLSAWVEKGIEPPLSTNYSIEDGQVIIPESAEERKGIQPVVKVLANEKKRAEVDVGEPVYFTAEIEVPENTGEIIEVKWDFEGKGDFSVTGHMEPSGNSGSKAVLKSEYTYSQPGTYFVTVRAVSQRQGDKVTPFARIVNLDRVRVVVNSGTK